MPSGITIQNGDSVPHFYTASDQVSGSVAFSGNVNPAASSAPFTLAAGSDGTGSVIVTPAGLIGRSFFGVQDNQVLTMN